MTRGLGAAVLLAVALSGCQMAARSVKPPPLEAEGEVWVYLQPVPQQLERLEFTIAAVGLSGRDGDAPLQLLLPEVKGVEARRQRLIAAGRVPAGSYGEVVVQLAKAALGGGDGRSDLLVPAEPVRVPLPLQLGRGRAAVVALTLDPASSIQKGFGFTPSLRAVVPELPLVERLGFVTNTGSDALTVFDRVTRRVVAAIPTGRDPQGMTVDLRARRLFVALAGEDQVACYDLATGVDLGRIRLQPGDRPAEVGITPDGRLLVTANRGSSTASFLDPQALVEIDRVPTGLQPASLLVDRSGRRAYVFNRGSSSVTVLDLASRRAASSFPTEAEPLRGALNRAGDRLYVASATSPYVASYAVPSLALQRRTFVGPGVTALRVETRTDFVQVAKGLEGRIQVYDPAAFLPVAELPVDGAATWLAIDDLENVLLAVVPERRAVAAFEVNGRRALASMDVGEEPYAAAVAVGERN